MGGGRGDRGDRGNPLLPSLDREMLQWALGGFQPAGAAGLKPTSGSVCVCDVSLMWCVVCLAGCGV